MRKIYVDVDVHWKKDGTLVPTAIWWEQGIDETEKYEIDAVVKGPYTRTGKTFGFLTAPLFISCTLLPRR